MTARLGLILAALALAPATAHAFPTGEQFDLDPIENDGAGGLPFTGSPRWAGHTCAVCHTGAPGRVGLRLESAAPELFTDGWKPGTTYHLRVVLTGAWAAKDAQPRGDDCGFATDTYSRCDDNGFAMEIDDSLGRPLGKLAALGANGTCGPAPAQDADARVMKDGTAITMNGAHHAQLAWDLCWTAPEAGYGPLVAYLAAVDGNGGDGTEAYPHDVTDDDVAAGAVPLPEFGAPPPLAQTGGCAAADPTDGALVLVALALGLGLRTRRRRLALVAAALLAQGCVHVRPRQRETLAKRKMTFAPDPGEDELDLHMQESREGASGGYGSAGGGCGCN